MKVQSSTYIKEQIESARFIEKKDIFSLYIVHGIENFNLKEVWMASVRSDGSGRTGQFWSEYSEALDEGKKLLDKTVSDWNDEMNVLRKVYEAE